MVSPELAKELEPLLFPVKLYKLAHSKDVKSVYWSCNGSAVKLDTVNLSKECFCPEIFNVTDHKHVFRQLSYYGFQRIQKVAHVWEFFHPYFLADRFDLVQIIRRKGKKNQNFVKASDVDADFLLVEKRKSSRLKNNAKKGNLTSNWEKTKDESDSESSIVQEVKLITRGRKRKADTAKKSGRPVAEPRNKRPRPSSTDKHFSIPKNSLEEDIKSEVTARGRKCNNTAKEPQVRRPGRRKRASRKRKNEDPSYHATLKPNRRNCRFTNSSVDANIYESFKKETCNFLSGNLSSIPSRGQIINCMNVASESSYNAPSYQEYNHVQNYKDTGSSNAFIEPPYSEYKEEHTANASTNSFYTALQSDYEPASRYDNNCSSTFTPFHSAYGPKYVSNVTGTSFTASSRSNYSSINEYQTDGSLVAFVTSAYTENELMPKYEGSTANLEYEQSQPHADNAVNAVPLPSPYAKYHQMPKNVDSDSNVALITPSNIEYEQPQRFVDNNSTYDYTTSCYSSYEQKSQYYYKSLNNNFSAQYPADQMHSNNTSRCQIVYDSQTLKYYAEMSNPLEKAPLKITPNKLQIEREHNYFSSPPLHNRCTSDSIAEKRTVEPKSCVPISKIKQEPFNFSSKSNAHFVLNNTYNWKAVETNENHGDAMSITHENFSANIPITNNSQCLSTSATSDYSSSYSDQCNEQPENVYCHIDDVFPSNDAEVDISNNRGNNQINYDTMNITHGNYSTNIPITYKRQYISTSAASDYSSNYSDDCNKQSENFYCHTDNVFSCNDAEVDISNNRGNNQIHCGTMNIPNENYGVYIPVTNNSQYLPTSTITYYNNSYQCNKKRENFYCHTDDAFTSNNAEVDISNNYSNNQCQAIFRTVPKSVHGNNFLDSSEVYNSAQYRALDFGAEASNKNKKIDMSRITDCSALPSVSANDENRSESEIEILEFPVNNLLSKSPENSFINSSEKSNSIVNVTNSSCPEADGACSKTSEILTGHLSMQNPYFRDGITLTSSSCELGYGLHKRNNVQNFQMEVMMEPIQSNVQEKLNGTNIERPSTKSCLKNPIESNQNLLKPVCFSNDDHPVANGMCPQNYSHNKSSESAVQSSAAILDSVGPAKSCVENSRTESIKRNLFESFPKSNNDIHVVDSRCPEGNLCKNNADKINKQKTLLPNKKTSCNVDSYKDRIEEENIPMSPQ